jgi:hypothetical protein
VARYGAAGLRAARGGRPRAPARPRPDQAPRPSLLPAGGVAVGPGTRVPARPVARPRSRARTRGSGRVRGRARSRVLLLVQSAGSPERQRVLVSWVLWRCVCAEERGALCLEQNVWTKVRAKHYHALG